MTTLAERFRKVCELVAGLNSRESAGIALGRERENARLKPLLDAAAECVEALEYQMSLDEGGVSKGNNNELSPELAKLEAVIEKMEVADDR